MAVVKLSEKLQLNIARCRQSWQYKVDPSKVLVLFFPWLRSQEKHLEKYRDLYLSKGLDVLTVKSTAMDFLWPNNSHKLGRHILQVMSKQCHKYDNFLLHTMSVGSFNMTIFRMLAAEEGDQIGILRKCRGVIYDSVVAGADEILAVNGKSPHLEYSKPVKPTDKMLHGISLSVSKNKTVQLGIEGTGRLYFHIFKKQTVDFYNKASDIYREQPLPIPTLFYASKDDPMIDTEFLESIAHLWRTKKDIPVVMKIWDKSGHAQHLARHPEEYVNTLEHFISLVFKEHFSTLSKNSKL